MRIAQTIDDLKELFAEYNCIPRLEQDKVILFFPDIWVDPVAQIQAEIMQKPIVPTDPEDLKFARLTRNTIWSLVKSPQFWRVTTVADQVTRFYGLDFGSMPPMFMRGKNRRPSIEWGMTGLTKKANEPFTIHFESEDKAMKFWQAIVVPKMPC